MRTDAGAIRLGATPIEVRPNGSRVYRGVATYGDVVLEYGPSDPGGQRSEFVPAEVALAPEVLRDTVGAPFTIVHPGDMLRADDEEGIRDHTQGSVLRAEANWKADPPEMIVDVVVLTSSAQDHIESGRIRELSLGYECQDELKSGVHQGRPYQVVQRRRRINHLSAVPAARSTTPDGRRARLDGVRLDEALAPGEARERLVIEFADARCWAKVGDGKGMTIAPTPEKWLESLRQARRLLVPADDLGGLPPVAGQSRADGLVLPPSRMARARLDAASLAQAPAGHPAMAALVVPYPPAMPSWRGYSEPVDRSWVAFWPREVAGRGLLFTRRDRTGATLGAPEALPPRPYAHGDTTMEDDLQIDPALTERTDAEVPIEAGEAGADPATAALAMFSPEAVEVLKTLPEADMKVLQDLVLGARGEAAEEAVIAAGSGDLPVVEVDDATVPAGDQALTMDAVRSMIADAIAGIGKKTDAVEPPKKDGDGANAARRAAAATTTASTERVDATDVARRAADIVNADQALVDRVRRAGHRCDSARDARSAALAVIKATSPATYAVAERALKEGRRDDFVALFDAAEDARRADLLEDQLLVVGAAQRGIAGQQLGAPNFSGLTAPDRAVTGD